MEKKDKKLGEKIQKGNSGISGQTHKNAKIPLHMHLSISHFQFANNAIIFSDAYIHQLGFIHCILKCFEAVSRLNVNLRKSVIYGVGKVQNLKDLPY